MGCSQNQYDGVKCQIPIKNKTFKTNLYNVPPLCWGNLTAGSCIKNRTFKRNSHHLSFSSINGEKFVATLLHTPRIRRISKGCICSLPFLPASHQVPFRSQQPSS